MAFASILSSSVSLVSTSTNLVVNGLMTGAGLAPMRMFELAPVGIPIAVVGLLYMFFIGRRWIPERAGPDGLIDDDVAFVSPWGFDLSQVRVPALFVQGGMDRIVPAAHGRWQTHATPHGELWLRPEDGHISVLNASLLALDWLLANAN